MDLSCLFCEIAAILVGVILVVALMFALFDIGALGELYLIVLTILV